MANDTADPQDLEQAITLFTGLNQDLQGHKTHVMRKFERQDDINERNTARIVRVEKRALVTRGAVRVVDEKLDQILENQKQSRNNWPVWIGIIASTLIGSASLIVMIIALFAKGGTP